MKPSGNDYEKYIPSKNKEAYISAVRDFTQLTIQDPSFFDKTPEEQKEIAMSILQGNKQERKKDEV